MKKQVMILMLLLCVSCKISDRSNTTIQTKLVDRTNNAVKINNISYKLAESAEHFFRAGDYQKAASLYEQLLMMQPDNKDYWLMLAESKRMSGNFKESVAYYDKAMDSEMHNKGAVEGKVLALTQEGDFVRAVDCAVSHPEIIEGSWKILNAIAIAYASNGNMEKATDYYHKAMYVGGSSPSIMNNIALSMALTGNVSDAIDTFKQILASGIADAKLYEHISMNLALAYSIDHKLDKAEAIASRYLKGREFYNNMGVYAHIANNNKAAKIFLNKALNQSIVHYDRAWNNLNKVQ